MYKSEHPAKKDRRKRGWEHPWFPKWHTKSVAQKRIEIIFSELKTCTFNDTVNLLSI